VKDPQGWDEDPRPSDPRVTNASPKAIPPLHLQIKLFHSRTEIISKGVPNTPKGGTG